MAKSIHVSRQVYAKIFVHAAKYFDCPLMGFLVGSIDKTNGTYTVHDVLSVSHAHPAGPIFDMAADLVSFLNSCYL
jgi:hypothetical protein